MKKLLLCAVATWGALYGAEELIVKEMGQEESLFQTEAIPRGGVDFEVKEELIQRKSPMIAVGLSSLVPGLGHTYLGDYLTAGELFGSVAGSLGVSYLTIRESEVSIPFQMLSGNLQFYGVYAAYRDARKYNMQQGYTYAMPEESFRDLALAPFQWSVIKKPEVWGGLIGALAASSVVMLAYPSNEVDARCMSLSVGELFPLAAFPVGIGEESYFRGFIQPMLMEKLHPVGGITLASLFFGAVHLGNAQELDPSLRSTYYTVSIPFITGLGGYLGWMAYKNNSLKESVALHAWYDFVVFLGSYSASRAASIKSPAVYSFSINF